jgi:hypothetical protein
MKRVLALLAVASVIASAASISSASPTLDVWTVLVAAGKSGTHYTYGNTPVTATTTGYYGVQIWAEVVGGAGDNGIQIMDANVYALDGQTGNFAPVLTGTNGVPSQTATNVNSVGYSVATPVYEHLNIAGNPGTEPDAWGFSIGTTNAHYNDIWPNLANFGEANGTGVYSGAQLLTTEVWYLSSLAAPVTLGVYVTQDSYTPAYFTSAEDGTYSLFNSVNTPSEVIVNAVPEPNTMMMIGMGLTSLVGMVIRRRKTA